jgi:hypothetical protein
MRQGLAAYQVTGTTPRSIARCVGILYSSAGPAISAMMCGEQSEDSPDARVSRGIGVATQREHCRDV